MYFDSEADVEIEILIEIDSLTEERLPDQDLQ